MQTEIYAFQMLLRILLLQVLFSDEAERQKERELDQHRYLSDRYRWAVEDSAPKVRRPRVKLMLQEIQQIFTFYKLEIMVERADCRNKPEIVCLL